MAYIPLTSFPTTTFGQSLADLPGAMEEARLREARRSLGDLGDLGKPANLEKGANRLLSQGDFEGAQTLLKQALGLRGVEQRGEADRNLLEWFKRNQTGGLPKPTEPPSYDPFAAASQPVPGAAAVPAPIPAPGQRSELPPVPGEANIQLAQAPGATQTDVSTPVGVPPQAAPQTPAAPAKPPEYGPVTSPDVAQARRDAEDAIRQLNALPPMKGMANSPQVRALTEKFREAMSRANARKDEEDYAIAIFQAKAAGLPTFSKADFEAIQKRKPGLHEEATKAYTAIGDKGQSSRDLLNTLDRMDQLRNDPNFQSGNLTGGYDWFVNAANSILQITGGKLPEYIQKIVDPHQKALAISEEFTALANSAIKQAIGTLGSGFSNADREFMERQFSRIGTSPQGIARINDYMRKVAERSDLISTVAEDYMHSSGINATPYGLHRAIRLATKEAGPLFIDASGNRTELGRQLEADAFNYRTGQSREPPRTANTFDFMAPITAPVTGAIRSGIGAIRSGIGSLLQGGGPEGPSSYEIPTYPGMAKGGPVKAGQPYMVGEKGSETYMPKGETIMPHHEGKVYYSQKTGKPMGRIKNGKCVPFGRG